MKAQIRIFMLIMGLILSAATSLYAQQPAPKLVAPDSLFDFGFFATDARVAHSYLIRNEGTDTLRISKVNPGCGCTAAPLRSENIAPHDSTFLDVYFDSRRLTGLVKKQVTIISNDSAKPSKELGFIAITGKKHPYVAIDPEVVNFGRLSIQKLDTPFPVTLTNRTDAPLELAIVDYSKDYISLKLEKTKLIPGESTKLEVIIFRVPNDPKFYNFSATLSAEIKDIKIHLTIPMIGRLNRIE